MMYTCVLTLWIFPLWLKNVSNNQQPPMGMCLHITLWFVDTNDVLYFCLFVSLYYSSNILASQGYGSHNSKRWHGYEWKMLPQVHLPEHITWIHGWVWSWIERNCFFEVSLPVPFIHQLPSMHCHTLVTTGSKFFTCCSLILDWCQSLVALCMHCRGVDVIRSIIPQIYDLPIYSLVT